VFQAYRGLLCHYSGLFRTLLNGRLQENDSLSLPNDNLNTLQLFYDWFYSGEAVYDDATELGVRGIIDLCFFADAYMVQQLKDRALKLYFLRFLKDWQAPQDLTRPVYEKTAKVSSLRKLHVDIVVEAFSFDNVREYMDDDPKEFPVDLLEACRDRQIAPGSCSAIDRFLAMGRGEEGENVAGSNVNFVASGVIQSRYLHIARHSSVTDGSSADPMPWKMRQTRNMLDLLVNVASVMLVALVLM
jgi:hypothetical protein